MAQVIGILDLQGGVFEHLEHLERLGVEAKPVKYKDDFKDLAGLILPGGESTCLGKLLNIFGIGKAIKDAYANGMKIWGTCAGTILLATKIIGEEPHLSLLDIEVERNGFGSQLDSFHQEVIVPKISDKPVYLTYIRAPKIHSVGPDVEVLLELNDYVAAVETESTQDGKPSTE